MINDIKNVFCKEKKGIKEVFSIVLLISFIGQYLWIACENIFHLREYLGFDLSMDLLYIDVVAREGKMFPDTFESTTAVFSSPLEGIVCKLTGDLFWGQAVTNILYLGIVIVFEYFIIKLITDEKEYHIMQFLIVACLTMCPFVYSQSHELSFGSCMNYPVAYYLDYTMCEMYVLWTYYEISLNRENIGKFKKLVMVIGAMLVTMTLIPKHEYVGVMVFVPMAVCTIISACVKNDAKEFVKPQAIFSYLLFVLEATGLILNKIFVSYQTATGQMHWCSREQFPSEVLHVFSGYFSLLAGIPDQEKVSVFSIDSISFIAGIVITIGLFVALIFIAKYSLLNTKYLSVSLPLLCIVAIDTIFYFFFDTTYPQNEGSLFAERYLTLSFMALCFLFALFVSKLDDNLLVKWIGLALFVGMLLTTTILSDYNRTQDRIDMGRIDEIKGVIDSECSEAKLVYFVGSDKNDVRYMRVLDIDRIYKDIWDDGRLFHWGDYTYSDEAAEDQGPYMIFCRKDCVDIIPQYVKVRVTECGEWDEYILYKGEGTVYDFKTDHNMTLGYDFPYSPSVTTDHIEMNEDGDFISDGSQGIVVYGPNSNMKTGRYDVILEYEVLESSDEIVGVFDIVKDESEVAYSTAIMREDTTVGFYDVQLLEDTWLQYRVGESEGTKIKINKVIVKKNDSSN